jgi:hypothetical protein
MLIYIYVSHQALDFNNGINNYNEDYPGRSVGIVRSRTKGHGVK